MSRTWHARPPRRSGPKKRYYEEATWRYHGPRDARLEAAAVEIAEIYAFDEWSDKQVGRGEVEGLWSHDDENGMPVSLEVRLVWDYWNSCPKIHVTHAGVDWRVWSYRKFMAEKVGL